MADCAALVASCWYCMLPTTLRLPVLMLMAPSASMVISISMTSATINVAPCCLYPRSRKSVMQPPAGNVGCHGRGGIDMALVVVVERCSAQRRAGRVQAECPVVDIAGCRFGVARQQEYFCRNHFFPVCSGH